VRLQGGDVNAGKDYHWYRWASDKTQTYKTIWFPVVDVNIKKWKVDLFFLFHCELNIRVISTEMAQKLSALNVAQGSEQLRYLHVVLLLATYTCHQSNAVQKQSFY
jgi:hypothetical protein